MDGGSTGDDADGVAGRTTGDDAAGDVDGVAGRSGRGERPVARTTGDDADDVAGAVGDGEADAERVGAPVRAPRPWPPDDGAGDRLVRANVWATAVFAAVSAAAALVPDPLEYVAVPVDLVLFVVGCAAFLWAYAVAIGRSRYEALTMAGVFFLADRAAPARVTRSFRVVLAVQVVVAVGVAAARPFTALAFGVLVPMLGLGLMALWGARHGTYPAKPDPADGG